MKKLSIDRAQGMAFLRNTNAQRYGSLMTDLANQFLRKNDQCPSNLTEAYNLLVNFKSNSVEKIFRKRDKKRDEKKKVDGSETDTIWPKLVIKTYFKIYYVITATSMTTMQMITQNQIRENRTK